MPIAERPGFPYQPVVIIGAARSGTRFLRDLIGASSAGAVVPYDINYVWRYRHEARADDMLLATDADEIIRRFIRSQLIRMSGARGRRAVTLIVEKTVSNCLRIPFIENVLPEARFIHLVRDGRDVVESSCRMWREPVDPGYLLRKLRYIPLANYRYAFWFVGGLLRRLVSTPETKIWGVRYPGIQEDMKAMGLAEICALQWRRCVEHASTGLAGVPAARQLTVRYENLTASIEEVNRVIAFLGLPDGAEVRDAWLENVRCIPPRWPAAFDRSTWDKVMALLAPTLCEWGYLG